MPKMQQNMFGGRAAPGLLGDFMCSPRLNSRNGGPTSKGKGERKGRRGKGKGDRRDGRRGEDLPLPLKRQEK